MQNNQDFLLMAALIHQNGGELRKLINMNVKTVAADFPLDVEIINSVDEIEDIRNCIIIKKLFFIMHSYTKA